MRVTRFASQLSMLSAVALVNLPAGAQACAVCFGKTDSPLGKGLHWGVFALLMFVFVMLAAFGVFAVYLARRSMAVEAEEAAESGQRPTTSSRDPHAHPLS
jgi:4-hydroxybenzoate polyprenyltransferase